MIMFVEYLYQISFSMRVNLSRQNARQDPPRLMTLVSKIQLTAT